MIVKVQQSIATTHAAPQMLIYNEDRSVTYEAPLTAPVARVLGARLKAYFYATIDGAGLLSLDGAAPEQDW